MVIISSLREVEQIYQIKQARQVEWVGQQTKRIKWQAIKEQVVKEH